MKILASFVKVIAVCLFPKDCEVFRYCLRRSYKKYRAKGNSNQTTLHMLLISGEDHRFFIHGGFDVIAIARALWKFVRYGRREGASTIEQQILRVLTGKYEKTIGRKLKEILLATLITDVVPKHQLPGLYLDIAYFGWRMNGIVEACSMLGVEPEHIPLSISAELVARLKYPQPHIPPIHRLYQIRMRRDHLLNLYNKHSAKNVYRGLMQPGTYETIQTVSSRKTTEVALLATS